MPCHARLSRRLLAGVAVCLGLVGLAATNAAAASAQSAPGDYGLAAMAAFDQLPNLSLQERMGHLSSIAPGRTNADWDNYLYTDSDGGRVILDEQGPGVIYRLHLTLASGANADTTRVKVYLDGAITPQIDDSMADLASGTTAPFLSPLVENVNVGSGGYTYYLPIPYAKNARVSLSGPGSIYWQVDWHGFPAGTPIRTWTGTEDSSQVRSLWDNAGTDPDAQPDDESVSGTTALPGDGGRTRLADLAGPQEISAITMKIPGVVPTRGAYATVLNDTHIRIYWDHEATPSVDAPLGSFFGMGYFGAAPTRGTAIGMRDDGTMYMYFPMPFEHDATIELVNEMRGSGDKPVPGVTYTITHRPFTGSFATVGYFRTQWTPQTVAPSPGGNKPAPHPVQWLDVSGAGKVVGIVESRVSAQTPGTVNWGLGFLEGNVHMFVDGSKTPAWRDNGTEDTFDGGYYFVYGPVENPNSGDNIKTTTNDRDPNPQAIAAYREFVGDAIPFRNHLTINDEPGSANYPYYTTDYPLVFYYSQQPRMARSDGFDVGDTAAAAQHKYQITGQTQSANLVSTYDGYLYDPPLPNPPLTTGLVNTEEDSSQFVLRTDPRNQGVVLRRTYDQTNGRQTTDVYVDGKYAGRWYQAYGNNVSQWAQDDFTIPAADTRGKSSISVQLRWVAGSPPWTEAGYESYSIQPAPAEGQFHVAPPVGSVLAHVDPPPTLVDGTAGTVTGTFINATNVPAGNVRYRLSVPNGWTAIPISAQPAIVAAHQAVRLSWKVTAPTGPSPTHQPAIVLDTSYDTIGGPTTAESAPEVTTTVPPVQIASFAAGSNTAQPGQQATFQVRLHNNGSAPETGNLTISGPSGWTVAPATQTYSLAGGADQTFTATTTNPGTEGQDVTLTASTTYADGQQSDQADATLFTGHLRCDLGDTPQPVWHADPGYGCTLDQGYTYYDPNHSVWSPTAPANYCWAEAPPQPLLFHVTVPAGVSGTLRLFLVDGDNFAGGRSETVYVDGKNLGTFSGFQQGKWVTANVTTADTSSGRIDVEVDDARQGSNVVVSGVEF